ncbi:hypothetical protein [Bacillus sp. AFS041924]|uniref:hypothetical protein n=1 Tax=Bacillus sp. AFS041924 TaxID=2033503 RepID=UPI000BFE9DD3|nr:hypothetical protein [Bacillus sp. AFS041924]PGS50607.1 hypothetical protein COC46_12715 [Bacillus sp. AFS041924]
METFRFATEDDFGALLSLDASVYPPEWQVTMDFVKTAWERNNEIYRVLENEVGIQGFLAFFGLDQESFEMYLVGELDEKELCHHIVPYKKGNQVYLYLATMVVNQQHQNKRLFGKRIIQEIQKEINRVRAIGCIVPEIGAIAITTDGKRVLDRSALRNCGEYASDPSSTVYRGKDFQ